MTRVSGEASEERTFKQRPDSKQGGSLKNWRECAREGSRGHRHPQEGMGWPCQRRQKQTGTETAVPSGEGRCLQGQGGEGWTECPQARLGVIFILMHREGYKGFSVVRYLSM